MAIHPTAVIDKKAFASITEYIEFARGSSDMDIICGGTYDDSEGYFIQPTVVLSTDPRSKLMCEEIFGPVVTVHVYPEMEFEGLEQYEYKSKGQASATVSCYWQVGSCAGVCLFPVIFFGNYPLIDYLNAVTGWGMDIQEALEAGARIQTLRQTFNIREGIDPSQIKLPERMAGIPPKNDGPLADITIDIDSLKSEYYKAMGWDPESGQPTDATLERLGLKGLVLDVPRMEPPRGSMPEVSSRSSLMKSFSRSPRHPFLIPTIS